MVFLYVDSEVEGAVEPLRSTKHRNRTTSSLRPMGLACLLENICSDAPKLG